MVFKSGVLSIGNYLICLDPKSCIFIFKKKNFEIFLYRASGTLKKKSQNIFLKNGFQKWGAIDRKLFYSPRSKTCKIIFFKKFKNLIGGKFKEKTEKKNVGFLFYFLSMKKAVTSKLLMRLS